MAALALPSELARMNVILLMARYAVLGKLHLASRLAMAINTLVLTMRPRQCKPSLLKMIEGPQCPAIGAVASVAICTQSALMDVVFLMTVDAMITGSTEGLRAVTLRAADNVM
jgi:hypothetical protein